MSEHWAVSADNMPVSGKEQPCRLGVKPVRAYLYAHTSYSKNRENRSSSRVTKALVLVIFSRVLVDIVYNKSDRQQ